MGVRLPGTRRRMVMQSSRNFSARRPRLFYPAAVAIAGLPLLSVMLSGPASAAPVQPAPGKPASGWVGQVQWTSQQVAPGVTVRNGVLANPAAAPHWTVTIDATTTRLPHWRQRQ